MSRRPMKCSVVCKSARLATQQALSKKTDTNKAPGSIYTTRLIRHESMVWVYREIHAVLRDCALEIGEQTGFLDQFIIDSYLRAAAGILRNKAIFYDEDTMEQRGFPGTNLHTGTEIALLNVGIDFLFATTEDPPEHPFPRLYPLLPFVPAVYNILIESFMRTTKDYCDLVRQSFRVRVQLDEHPEDPNVPQLMARLAHLESRMGGIEQRVGGNRMTLYGVVKRVHALMCPVRDYQLRITHAYERLVMQLARQYGRSAMQVEDNFQHGAFGLQRSIYYFDPAKGKAFSGIARWWIRASILLKLKEEANFVRVPNSVWRQHKAYEAKAHELGIQGDLPAIAEVFGHETEEVETVYTAVMLNRPMSLDAPISTDEDNTGRIGDHIPDSAPSPEEELDAADSMLPRYMLNLSETERRVVCYAYGLFDMLPEQQAVDPDEVFCERLRQIAAETYRDDIRGVDGVI